VFCFCFETFWVIFRILEKTIIEMEKFQNRYLIFLAIMAVIFIGILVVVGLALCTDVNWKINRENCTCHQNVR
jgi:hypothetical protein